MGVKQPAKILIANRGEVACRILHAVHEMGLHSLLVVSPQDENSWAATLAQEKAVLPGRSLAETYLNGAAILQIAKDYGATHVHPGFGFLSEDAAFARAVIKSGLIWIGPSPESMDAVSNKYAAKKLVETLGIPTAPWMLIEEKASGKTLEKISREVGFPCLVKAAAGGGGKGLKRVNAESELAAAVESAQREAKNAFGDERVFIEKMIDDARHLEIQVFGDAEGKVHVFGERDCSLQRRFQKVIEESPAPHLTQKMRDQLEGYARKIAETIDYRNAGTVEFLMDSAGKIYFMEVNTRLQVEHGVTEERYGIDLVKMQLQTALDFAVDGEGAPRGHVIQLRLYAEDSLLGFLPQPGLLHTLEFPVLKGLRIESGVRPGDTITGDYDPMIAKILVTATDRKEAIDKALYVLRQTKILGPTTNRDFLIEMLGDPVFQKGEVTTQYLTRHYKPALPKEFAHDLALAIAKSATSASPAATQASPSVFTQTAWGKLS